jgi:hypothetical protein
MSSALIGNQPLGGYVTDQIGVLFTNMGTAPVLCTLLEFNNNSTTDDVVLEVFQPDGNVMVRVKRSVLDAGYTEQQDVERIVCVGESLAARASVANTIQWRVNLRAL